MEDPTGTKSRLGGTSLALAMTDKVKVVMTNKKCLQ
jgi:hypothetical protein